LRATQKKQQNLMTDAGPNLRMPLKIAMKEVVVSLLKLHVRL